MAKNWFFPTDLAGFVVSSEDFWRQNKHRGWVTIFALVFILIWQSLRAVLRYWSCCRSVAADATDTYPTRDDSSTRISEIISDADLRNLIDDLEGKFDEKESWENVVNKRNHLLSYDVECCKPQDGPLKYRSVTTFENCSTEFLRDFYLDNEYRKEWDKMLVEHKQLQVYEINGTEIGHTIKKFPLLTPREYVLAWRVWEGKGKTFYCFIKECEHALAPRQRKYVRVGFFRSGWRIRKVPGRDACEIKMVHQEDIGINVEMAKLIFAKGIWSYICKMDAALRKYASRISTQANTSLSALELIQKIPPELETETSITRRDCSVADGIVGTRGETEGKKFWKKPSKKCITKGLLLLGGVICLSRGHASLGAKLAAVCILKKLVWKEAASSQAELSRAKSSHKGRARPSLNR